MMENVGKSADNVAMELIALAHPILQALQETTGEQTCYNFQ